jgi:hypothetical protein
MLSAAGLMNWIDRRPAAASAAFAALHLAVWTALPALLHPPLRPGVVEADKLPPLPWWLVDRRLPADRP